MVKLDNLFSDFIYTEELKNIDNESIVSFLENLRETEGGVSYSNRGGYQTDNITPDKASPELHKLANTVYTISNEVAKAAGFSPVEIAGLWGNINYKNCYNLPHFHPHCVLAAVYYPKAQPDQGDISFKRDHVSAHYLLHGTDTQTEYNRPTVCHSPMTGKLIIFPAWIEHQVGMNETDTSRVSLAFNIVLAGMQQ